MGLIMLPLVLPEMIVAVSLLVVLLAIGVHAVALHGDPWPRADLHALLQWRSCPRRSSRWTGHWRRPPMTWARRPFSTFRLIILPLVMPGIISSAADLVHDLARRVHHRVLPCRHTGDAAGLHLLASSASRRRCPSSWRLGTILVCLSIILLCHRRVFPPPWHRQVRRPRIPEASCDVRKTRP